MIEVDILGDIEGALWGYSLFKNLLIVDCWYDFNLFALRNTTKQGKEHAQNTLDVAMDDEMVQIGNRPTVRQ